jgi:hypothetical protein
MAGEEYTLTCQVTGGVITMPTYQWFKNDSLVTGQTSATLSFSPLEEADSGVYMCEGTRSSITRTSTAVRIDVAGKCMGHHRTPCTHLRLMHAGILPRLPVSVTETSITSSSVGVQWTLTEPYDSSYPETFTVFYGVDPGQLNISTPEISTTPTRQTYSTQLNSLQPGTLHFYRIESNNKITTVVTDIFSFTTIDTGKTNVAILHTFIVTPSQHQVK